MLIIKFFKYNCSILGRDYAKIVSILTETKIINDFYKVDNLVFCGSEKYNSIYNEISMLILETENQKYLRHNKHSINSNLQTTPPEKDSIIDKSLSKLMVNGSSFQITIINDVENSYSPFISFVIDKITIINDNSSNYTSNNTIDLCIEINTFNYIAGVWEPLLEKTSIICEILNNYADANLNLTNINIRVPVDKENKIPTNINLSNMSVNLVFILDFICLQDTILMVR